MHLTAHKSLQLRMKYCTHAGTQLAFLLELPQEKLWDFFGKEFCRPDANPVVKAALKATHH